MFTQRTSTIPGIGLVFRFNQVSVKSVCKAITMVAMVLALTLSVSAVTHAQGKGRGNGNGGGDDPPAPYIALRLPLPGGDIGQTEWGGMEISDANSAGDMHLIANSNLGGDVHWVVDSDGTVISSEVVPDGLNVYGVNQWGQQVGQTFGVDGYRAFLRQNGVTMILDPVMGDECVARDINESGTMIVGADYYRDPVTGGYTTVSGVYWRLDANGNVVSAHTLDHFLPHEVSDNETMCGRTGAVSAVEPALLLLDEFDNQIVVPFGFPAGSTYGEAYVVNNNDTVAGFYKIDGDSHGFMWTLGSGITMVPALPPDGRAITYGLNDSDIAVGVTKRPDVFGWRGMIHADSVTTDIHDLFNERVYVQDAHKINKENYIIGRGYTTRKNGRATSNWSALLLIPNTE